MNSFRPNSARLRLGYCASLAFAVIVGGFVSPDASPAAATLTFAAPVAYQVGATPTDVTSADLNGDGFSDLIVGTSQGVAILMNNGDGTFAPFAPYPTGEFHHPATAAAWWLRT